MLKYFHFVDTLVCQIDSLIWYKMVCMITLLQRTEEKLMEYCPSQTISVLYFICKGKKTLVIKHVIKL